MKYIGQTAKQTLSKRHVTSILKIHIKLSSSKYLTRFKLTDVRRPRMSGPQTPT